MRHYFGYRQSQRRQRREPLVQHRIFSDLIRMKLLFDPFGETDPSHFLDITRAAPESQSIECLHDLAIRAEFLFEGIGRLAGVRKSYRR